MPAYFQIPNCSSVNFVVSQRADGNFNSDVVDAVILDSRRRALIDLPWTQLREIHGIDAHWVDRAGECDGELGDIVGTAQNHAVLGIWVGDCAPVILIGARSIVGAHAGWRGLRDGVLDAAVSLMTQNGDHVIQGFVGPHIHQCCYQFGEHDLQIMVDRFGVTARGVDQMGCDALNVAACIRQFFATRNIPLFETEECTGCLSDKYFSHRVRGERERHIVGVWRTS